MTIYLIILLLILSGTLLNLNDKKISKNYCITISMFLFLISSTRCDIGIDYSSYELQYTYISGTNLWDALRYSKFEIGFNIINYIAHNTPWGFATVIWFSSFITVTCVGWFVYKYSGNKVMSFFLYVSLGYYTASYCWIRQYMAMSICLIAIIFLLNQKKIKAMLFFFLASTIHIGALVFIPLFFILQEKISIKKVILYFVVIIIIDLSWDSLVNLMGRIIPRFGDYFSTTYMQGKNLNSIIQYIYYFAIYYTFIPKKGYRNRDLLFFNCTVLSLALSFFALKIGILDRFPQYLSFVSILGISNIVQGYLENIHVNNRQIYRNIANTIIYLSSFIWFVYYVIYSDFAGVVPYISVF